MKITIAGTGYVGLSLATLLSQKNEVFAFDINQEKVDAINNRISPIRDEQIEEYFKTKELSLTATTDPSTAFQNPDYIIISTPTNYDDTTNNFDTTSIESVLILSEKYCPNSTIIIKSTVPVGYTEQIRKKFNNPNIFFSPEFLREGKALQDNLYPSRIVIGGDTKKAKEFGELLSSCSLDKTRIFYMSSTEAEAVKLFANTYLALRISFFNELDTYAEIKNLNTEKIISGISSDPRIGNYYNNPSFGYGGYCLPKDTKQLLSNFTNVPQNIISAIIQSNQTRKKHIEDTILKTNPKVIGIYRLTMKAESDNFRSSAILDIINDIHNTSDAKIIIYEPTILDDYYQNYLIEHDFETFGEECDIILANRIDSHILPFLDKVYTRDIFRQN